MNKFWTSALSVAGIAAVGAFVFLSLYKEWLHISIFGQLNAEQTFRLMWLFLWLVFAALFCMLITWIIQQFIKSRKPPQSGVDLSGAVFKDENEFTASNDAHVRAKKLKAGSKNKFSFGSSQKENDTQQ